MHESRARYILPSSRTAVSTGIFRSVSRSPGTIRVARIDVNVDQLRVEAKTYFQNEEYFEALDKCNQILDINPSDIAAINQKGIALASLKKFKEAEDEFTGAIYLNGRIPELWANRAATRRLQNKDQIALSDIDKAISLSSNKKDRDFLFNKAIILFGLGRYDDSRKLFDEILLKYSKFSNAISGKAAALDRLKKRRSVGIIT
jgi:tetratricopeptide (TPR) repeat protein